MKNQIPILLGTSLLAVSTVMASNAQANVDCNVAATLFNPAYDACVGAFDGQPVQSGGPDDLATQLLNVNDVFGEGDWTFLGKEDSGETSKYFDITGLNTSAGSILFDITEIENDFGSSFNEDYEISLVLKAGPDFSIYKWDKAASLLNGT